MDETVAEDESLQNETITLVTTFTRRLFCPLVLFSQIWGAVSVTLAIVWMRSYGGFAWSVDKIFNFHPVLMTTGMVYLYGQAILVYRLFRYKPKRILKLCHAVLQLTIFGISCIGLLAVFNFHNWKNIPNLYSLHSWVGLVMVVCFGMQFLMGFLVYLLPYASLRLRIMAMPFHRSFGLIMFGVAGATAVMGITEKAIFSSQDCWPKRTCDIINWMGLSVVLYVVSVLFLVATPEYRRVPLASD